MVWGISVRKIAYRLGIANVKRYREFEKVRCVDLVWFRYLRVVEDGWKFDGGIFYPPFGYLLVGISVS